MKEFKPKAVYYEEKVKEYFGAEIVVGDATYYEDDEYDTYALIFNVYEEDKPICDYMCGEFDINYAKLRHNKIYIIFNISCFNKFTINILPNCLIR